MSDNLILFKYKDLQMERYAFIVAEKETTARDILEIYTIRDVILEGTINLNQVEASRALYYETGPVIHNEILPF